MGGEVEGRHGTQHINISLYSLGVVGMWWWVHQQSMRYANSKQQTADSRQQTANSKQQTANSKTANSCEEVCYCGPHLEYIYQTANSKQQTANS